MYQGVDKTKQNTGGNLMRIRPERGRPSKLTRDLKARLITAIELTDLPMDKIAEHVGVTRQAFYKWVKKGEVIHQSRSLPDDDPEKIDESAMSEYEEICLELHYDLQQARTVRQNIVLSEIRNIAKRRGDWRAYQWVLKIWDPTYRTAEIIAEPEPEEEELDEDPMFESGAPDDPNRGNQRTADDSDDDEDQTYDLLDDEEEEASDDTEYVEQGYYREQKEEKQNGDEET